MLDFSAQFGHFYAGNEQMNAGQRTPPLANRPSDPLRELRLLVVDDQEDARDLMSVILEAAGATVTLADSASTAMTALADGQFAVLISDIGMPVADGYDLIRQVRGGASSSWQSAHIPALAVTAFNRPEDREKALACGFQEHLSKPVDIIRLVETVARLAGMTQP